MKYSKFGNNRLLTNDDCKEDEPHTISLSMVQALDRETVI